MGVVYCCVVLVAQDGHEDIPVVWDDVVCAPKEEEGDDKVEGEGHGEDALFEPGALRVDVCDVDGVSAEGGE